MSRSTKTYLDLVKECDNLPYPDEGEEYARVTSGFYHFRLKKVWKREDDDLSSSYVTVGYILPSIVAAMPWTDKFRVNHDARTVSIPWPKPTGTGKATGADDAHDAFETRVIAEQLDRARESDQVAILRKWRAEPYRILGLSDGREVRMARAGSAVFGIQTIGVHMLGFCHDNDSGIKLWIPRRSPTKQTFPGMLDNTVGGGLTADEDTLECLVREAEEEASLPGAWVKERARPVGTISYFSIRDERAGGPDEVGLLQPAIQVLYDLEMPPDMVPRPLDGEVAEFLLWTPKQTLEALREGRFKLNSAVAWIDFFIRHGYITAQNEPDYLELAARIHRRIIF
ncbi:NUDIX hydrolase domain-like protein [Xylariaceae sp. FL1651]|nr:NUDIX hydrolase domain-like protein [Xylariaceae sp. FL1651]